MDSESMQRYRDEHETCDCKKQSGSSSSQVAGSVSGSEIHNALVRFLEENPNISLPYGGTKGYWNCFVHRFHQMGFEIKRKPNRAISGNIPIN